MEAITSQAKNLVKGASDEARRKVVDSLRDLALSLEGPEDTYNRMETSYMETAMAKVGFDLKLFDTIVANKGPITTSELAEKTGAAPLLLGRLLRCMAASNMVTEAAEDTYQASNITEHLATPLGKAMIKFSSDIIGPIIFAIPDFLQKDGYKDITDPKHCPLQLGHKTELTSYEFLASNPEWARDLILMLKSRRDDIAGWLSAYPIEESAGLDPQRTLFVDVGGGAGWQCQELKQKHPDLSGRVILQDLQQMVVHFKPTEGVEAMEHDFFTPQPIKGAKYYYMRNIMHNYADEKALQILRNLKGALSEDSLILVDDIVLSDFKAPPRSVKMDIQMMGAHGAIERTEKQWKALFDSAGLKIAQIRKYGDIFEGSSIISVRTA